MTTDASQRAPSSDPAPRRRYGLPIAVTLAILLTAELLGIVYEVSVVFRIASLCLGTMFVIRYARRRRNQWRTSLEGEHLMMFSALVTLFFAYATTNSVVMWIEPGQPTNYGYWTGRDLVGLLLYVWVAFELAWRNWLLTLALRGD